jgi:hypothetical protein
VVSGLSILVIYTDPEGKSAPASASNSGSSNSSPIEVSTRTPTVELTVAEEEKAGLLRP